MPETRTRKRKMDIISSKEESSVEGIEKTHKKSRTSAGHPGSFPPRYIYHLAHTCNLESIRSKGLLSTKLLLQGLPFVSEAERNRICSQHRPKNILLEDPVSHEQYIIRDQSPMPPSALQKTLPEGVTASDWYELMNSFIFFWPSLERVNRHRQAHGPSANSKLSLLTFDAERMFRECSDRIFVSPINSGFAMRKAAKRSESATFVPYKEWVENGWPLIVGEGKRAKSNPPVEIAIKDYFPLEPYLVSIE